MAGCFDRASLHSARTRSFSWTNSLNVSVFSWTTSEEAATTAAKKAAQIVEHFIVAVMKLQLGYVGIKRCGVETSAAVERKGRAEAVGSEFITRVELVAAAELCERQQVSTRSPGRIPESASLVSAASLTTTLYWTPWTFLRLIAANHMLVTSLSWGTLPFTLLLLPWLTSARYMVPLSSVPIRLELPPLQLPESALLIYRECTHSYLRRTRK